MFGSGLHDDLVAVFGDGPGGQNDNNGKDISGNGIEKMPVVELIYRMAHV